MSKPVINEPESIDQGIPSLVAESVEPEILPPAEALPEAPSNDIEANVSDKEIQLAFVPGRLANSSHSFVRSLTRASNGGKEVLSGLGRVVKAISHGAVGGVRAVLGGGKFNAGFLSGSFAQFSSQVTANIEGPGGYAVSSLGGGIGVKLGGGDFSEGAITGAIGRALNDSLSHECT